MESYTTALPRDVRSTFELRIRPHRPVDYLPENAASWVDVLYVLVRDPPRPRNEGYDMRMGFERFQTPRELPVFDSGVIIDWVIPYYIELEEAHRRVNDASAPGDLWLLITLGASTWIIQRVPAPPAVARAMERYEDLRRSLSDNNIDLVHRGDTSSSSDSPQRGGARRSRLDPNAPRTAMITWAMEKATEHCPGLLPATISTLLRAESRTTTAVLNSKSQHQAREILSAALRRAGIQASLDGAPAPATIHGQHEQQMQHPGQVAASQQQIDSLVHLLNNQLELMNKWMTTQSEQHVQDQMGLLEVMRQYIEYNE